MRVFDVNIGIDDAIVLVLLDEQFFDGDELLGSGDNNGAPDDVHEVVSSPQVIVCIVSHHLLLCAVLVFNWPHLYD